MLLMIDYGIFYEFIPLEDVGKENPRIYCLEEVEVDKNYVFRGDKPLDLSFVFQIQDGLRKRTELFYEKRI